MKINKMECINCNSCIPYCPVKAIKIKDEETYIDQELCVICGVCIRAGVCKTEAIYMPETPWPRSLAAAFSGGGFSYYLPGKRYNPDGSRRYDRIERKMGIPEMSFKEVNEKCANAGSRGTNEMKSNDRTDRFKEGEVGLACELGRPGIGFYFRDLEKVSMALAGAVEIEENNPVSFMLDLETGAIKDNYQEIRDVRALSAIVECKIPEEKTPEIFEKILEVAKEIDTVFSVDIINRCQGGRPTVKKILDEAGIDVRINGKTNIGLGRLVA
ncbi:MAG: DUF362 domain-containing protein [Promethearchaeota archaeon]|jgi:Fe-S-cluster-containing hydrogenase component 2